MVHSTSRRSVYGGGHTISFAHRPYRCPYPRLPQHHPPKHIRTRPITPHPLMPSNPPLSNHSSSRSRLPSVFPTQSMNSSTSSLGSLCGSEAVRLRPVYISTCLLGDTIALSLTRIRHSPQLPRNARPHGLPTPLTQTVFHRPELSHLPSTIDHQRCTHTRSSSLLIPTDVRALLAFHAFSSFLSSPTHLDIVLCSDRHPASLLCSPPYFLGVLSTIFVFHSSYTFHIS